MKKTLSVILAGALLLCSGSCELKASVGDESAGISVNAKFPEPTETSATGESPVNNTAGTSAETAGSSSEAEEAEVSDSAENVQAPQTPESVRDDGDISGFNDIADFVTVESEETEYGVISRPVFSEEALDPADAAAANAFFSFMKNRITESVRAYLESPEYGGETFGAGVTLSDVKCAKSSDILSVLLCYDMYTALGVFPYYKAVSFDTATGKAVDPREAVSRALFTEEMAEEAVRQFAADLLSNSEYDAMLFNCYINGTVPSDSDLLPGYPGENVLAAVNSYKNGAEIFPDISEREPEWEALPISPTVYIDEYGCLYVCAGVSSSAVGSVINCMVAVGRSESESRVLNRYNPFGAVTGIPALSTAGAMSAAAGVVPDDVPEITFNVQAIDYISEEPDNELSRSYPAYVVSAYTGDYSHGIFGIGVLEPRIWRYSDGGWEFLSYVTESVQRTEHNREKGEELGALGAVFMYPDEYEAWALRPAAEARITDSAECFLACALFDGTTVSVLHGAEDSGSVFEPDAVLFQVTLNAGDWLRIDAPPDPADRSLAVEFATGFACGTYVVSADRGEALMNDRVFYALPNEPAW